MAVCKKLFVLFLVLFLALPALPGDGRKDRYRPLGSHGLSFYDIRKVWNPHWFQGNLRSRNYYEGWYFKIVSADASHRFAFIPGISLGDDGHAFIQVIDGSTGQTHYHRFSLDAFEYSRRRFAVNVGGNHFSDEKFFLDLGGDDERLQAHIRLDAPLRYPVTLFEPGIMSWYRFVPFMETYHGVVSMDHSLDGYLVAGADTIDFSGGRGYIEKDWGSSMPRSWIWMQSNTFSGDRQASFMLSVAHIPWLFHSFTGFLGFLKFDDQLYRFGTYTPARLVHIEGDADEIHIQIEDRFYKLRIRGLKGVRGELLAPVGGDMNRMIHESLDATLFIRLEDRHGNILFEGETTQAGLELVGDQKLLWP
jgi:tocopherol cyclase